MNADISSAQINSTDDTVATEVEQLLQNTDISGFLPHGYADHVDVNTLDVSMVDITGSNPYEVTLYARNVTLGTQHGAGNTTDTDSATVSLAVKPD